MNLRETILSADDLGSEIINVPEWGVTVEIRGLTVEQRAHVMETAYIDDKIDSVKLNRELIITCLYDPETGERIFTNADGDVIIKKNSGVVESLCKIASKLSGLAPDSQKESEKN